jgi:hypothetical protein
MLVVGSVDDGSNNHGAGRGDPFNSQGASIYQNQTQTEYHQGPSSGCCSPKLMVAPSYPIEQHDALVEFLSGPSFPYQSTDLHQGASHGADPGLATIIYSQASTMSGAFIEPEAPAYFFGNAALGFDITNSTAIFQSPTQLASAPFCAAQIVHAPPANGFAQSPFQPLQPKPTQQRSPVLSPAAATKPFVCKPCSKGYSCKGTLRRHDRARHGAGEKTGGRPRNSSKRL